MNRINVHGTALVLGHEGLLITGASGSGKSLLAHELVNMVRASSVFGSLVADDRVWISERNGRLLAEVPDALAGLIELRGFGPSAARWEPAAVVDRVAHLVTKSDATRIYEDTTEEIAGVRLPCLLLPEREIERSAAAISAWLAIPRF